MDRFGIEDLLRTVASDREALRMLLNDPERLAERTKLSSTQLAALRSADTLLPPAENQAEAKPDQIRADASYTFQTGSTITGYPPSPGPTYTFQTGSTITGRRPSQPGSTITFETGSTITGRPTQQQ